MAQAWGVYSMSAPNLIDLHARVENLKRANMLQKAALAEQTIEDLLKYLEVQDARIEALEGNQNWHITTKGEEHGEG